MKEISLGFSVEFEHYLEFDDSDGLILQAFLGEVQADDPVEINITMNDLVDDIIAEGKDQFDYQYLYNIAHEFNRYSELARQAAQIMEDDMNVVSDLFGISGDLG